MKPKPISTASEELDELIEKRIDIASTKTKSDDEVVQIAWLADGIDVWHRTNGDRGHSPAEARRFLISSITRLLEAQRNRIELEARDSERNRVYAELRHFGIEFDGKKLKKLRYEWEANAIRVALDRKEGKNATT